MGAPKGKARPDMIGNQYAAGCTTNGLPKVYTHEWITNEAKLFFKWMEKPDSMYFTTFATERGYCIQRLTEFANENKDFAEALTYARSWQLNKLVNLGLKNEINSGLTKFVLQNNHGWAERSTVMHKGRTTAEELLDSTQGDNDNNRSAND